MGRAAVMLAALLAAGCTSSSDAHPGTPADPADAGRGSSTCGCSAYGAARDAGAITAAGLTELSGLAASHVRPGLLFTHNDSGDVARFFALSGGALAGTFLLEGTTAIDWEDVATGPCTSGTGGDRAACLFIGDIGDNGLARQPSDGSAATYAIHRLVEPEPVQGSTQRIARSGYDTFPFRYPDGPHNAETLLVHPVTGRIYVVTKEGFGKRSTVFRLPEAAQPGVMSTLEKVALLAAPGPANFPATGGDISSCGDRLLLRTYDVLFEFRAAPGSTDPEAMFAATPTLAPVGSEDQGEAVAWLPDSTGYVTVSECVDDCSKLRLQEVSCR